MSNKEEVLGGLFDLLCDDFKVMLQDGTMTPSDRKALLEFLKQNDITCNADANPKMQEILKELPFDDNIEAGLAVN